MADFALDITSRPAGSYYGGKRGRDTSIPCPACGKPALLISKTVRRGADFEKYAHYIAFNLNEAGDAEPSYGTPCEYTREHGASR